MTLAHFLSVVLLVALAISFAYHVRAQIRTNKLWRALFEHRAKEHNLRAALGFYADVDNWSGGGNRKHSPVFKDRGKSARGVLSPAKESTNEQ